MFVRQRKSEKLKRKKMFLMNLLFNHTALHSVSRGQWSKLTARKRNMKEDSNKGRQKLKEEAPSKKPGERSKQQRSVLFTEISNSNI